MRRGRGEGRRARRKSTKGRRQGRSLGDRHASSARGGDRGSVSVPSSFQNGRRGECKDADEETNRSRAECGPSFEFQSILPTTCPLSTRSTTRCLNSSSVHQSLHLSKSDGTHCSTSQHPHFQSHQTLPYLGRCRSLHTCPFDQSQFETRGGGTYASQAS